jgi:RHS repeat-associated protein
MPRAVTGRIGRGATPVVLPASYLAEEGLRPCQTRRRAGRAGEDRATYDGAGDLTSDGTHTLTWNDRGQLSGVSGAGTTQTYTYAPTGLRASATVAGTTTSYLWDQVADLSGTTVTATNLPGAGTDQTLVRTATTPGARDLLSDPQGSVVATTTTTGALSTQNTYTPYGALSATGEANPTAPSYTGLTQDPASGLQYNRDRYYQPGLGRFLSQDPTGQAGGTDTYTYAGDDPTNATDPTGHEALLALGMLIPGVDVAETGLLLTTILEAAADEDLAVTATDVAARELAGGLDPDRLLFRFGLGPETTSGLASDGEAAVKNGFPHGISTSGKLPPRIRASGEYRSATVDQLTRAGLRVSKSGSNPYHYTVHLPRPVYDSTTDLLNLIFGGERK